jgi:hypothetical protein
MNKEKTGEKLELCDGEVCTVGRLNQADGYTIIQQKK